MKNDFWNLWFRRRDVVSFWINHRTCLRPSHYFWLSHFQWLLIAKISLFNFRSMYYPCARVYILTIHLFTTLFKKVKRGFSQIVWTERTNHFRNAQFRFETKAGSTTKTTIKLEAKVVFVSCAFKRKLRASFAVAFSGTEKILGHNLIRWSVFLKNETRAFPVSRRKDGIRTATNIVAKNKKTFNCSDTEILI